jgi:hypothetical protein
MNYRRTTTRRPSNEPSLSEPQPVLIAFDMPILTLRESPQTPTNPPLDQLLHLLRLSYTLLLFFSSTPLEPRGRSPASPHLPILDFRRPLLEHQSLLANLRKMKSQIGKHAGRGLPRSTPSPQIRTTVIASLASLALQPVRTSLLVVHTSAQ